MQMQTTESLSDYEKHISEIAIITEMYKKHSDILSTFINKLLELELDEQKKEGCLFDSKYEEYKFHIHYKIEENNTFTLNINNEIDTFKNNFNEYNRFTFGIDFRTDEKKILDKIIVEELFYQFKKNINKLLKKFEENINFLKNKISYFQNISFEDHFMA